MKKKSTAKNSPLAVIINALDDLKAQNIVAIDVTRLSDVMDTLVIANGSSNRQVRALAQHAADEAKKNGAPAMGMEGLDDGEWALVDFGDVVLHVMQPEVRDFYELEKLWLIPGSSETVDITALSTKKAPAKKSTATPKAAAAKKPGKPVVATKKPARKKVSDDVLVNQSDASKARQRKTAANARKKVAAKPAAAATPAKAGIYAKTGTRKPAAAKSTATKISAQKTSTTKTSAAKTTAAKSTAKKSAAPAAKSAPKKATSKPRAPRKA